MATTPYPFVASTVLTALQLNSTFNIPTTTKTASHTFIAGDAGTRVIMNSASATSFTTNTSIFAASDVIELQNIGAGVCTVTAGTATVSSAGPLAIPQNGGGRLVFSSASAATYFPTAVTQSASGLTCVKAETAVSGVTSATADGVFTSTHTNYLILLDYSTSTSNAVSIKLRSSGVSTSTNYNKQRFIADDTTLTGQSATSQTSYAITSTNGLGVISYLTLNLSMPQKAENTLILGQIANHNPNYTTGTEVEQISGNQNSNTQFDGIEFLVATGTFSATFSIYGYSKTV